MRSRSDFPALVSFVAWAGRNKEEAVVQALQDLITEYVGGPHSLETLVNELEREMKADCL